ncbi:MAG: cellulose synthase catalytic subunit [Candidatus Nanopelagicales bacterium]
MSRHGAPTTHRPVRIHHRPRLETFTEHALGARPPTPHDAGADDVRLAAFGAWFGRHERVMRLLAVVTMLWGGAYLVWRIGWSWDGAQPVLWVLLLACELFGLWSLGIQAWFSWRVTPTTRPYPTPGRSVDIYVCTYNESVEVLTATLLGCRDVRYPHTTYLLDDGRRPAMRDLADRLGARYLTREDNRHAKAGNINAALPRTDGELVFILDADHVPMPDSLDALVGYFDDPQLCLVQSPHDFFNQDSIQHYDVGRHEQSVFYQVVLPGKDRNGSAFWCGSATLLRREALLSIDGVATETIAEDFHTTIRLQRHGWTTRYHDETLVQGLSPHDLAAYLLQRDRWARGNLAVFRTPESPFRARELRASQRLSYFSSLTAYLAGPVRLLLLGILATILWTGWLPLSMDPWALALLWAPWVLLSLLAGAALSRGWMRIAEAVHFEQLTGWIYLKATRSIVRPTKTAFKVTPKEGIDPGGLHAVRLLVPLGVLAALIAVGSILRIAILAGAAIPLPTLPGLALWLVPLLGVIELRRVLRTFYLVGLRRQRRREFRFPTRVPAVLDLADGNVRHGSTLDLSGGGVRLLVDGPAALGGAGELTLLLDRAPVPGDRAQHVEAPGPDVVRIGMEVLGCRPAHVGDGEEPRWTVQAMFSRDDADALDAVTDWCYVRTSFERLRGARPAAPVVDVPRETTDGPDRVAPPTEEPQLPVG